jgi:MarR-like DNA-binding transcriptional regulator SgrR of sgrS sRNA
VAVFASAICGAVLAFLTSGCTPAHQATAMSATYTGTRIAACVQSVLAEEEQARALAHRLAETAAELEAEEIRSAALEHSPTTNEEIDKVLKDGAAK